MPKTLSHLLQQRLPRSPGVRALLEDAHALSGVECLLLDALGAERLRAPRAATAPLQGLERTWPNLSAARMRHRQALLAGREDAPRPWLELVVPMEIEGEQVGYWVMSGWRDPRYTDAQLRGFWVDLARQGSDLSWLEWRDAWASLPVCGPEKAAAWRRTLARWQREVMQLLHRETGALPQADVLPALVRRACRHTREHFAESLTLGQVAAACGVSPEHLSRVFHKATGVRFREYLAETRVQQVCQALTETADPIGDIALRNGFSTFSRFNRTFQAVTGMTPGQWRKRRAVPPE